MTQKITKETLSEAIEAEVKAAFLSEAVKEGVKFRFGSKELEFGSPEHIRVLQALLWNGVPPRLLFGRKRQ